MTDVDVAVAGRRRGRPDDGAARVAGRGPGRRGLREVDPRGLQRRHLERLPRRRRHPVPTGRRASRTHPSSTPTTSSRPAATRSGARSSRPCARSRPTSWSGSPTPATPSRSAPTCHAPGCPSPASTRTSARLGGGRLVRHLRELLASRPNVAFVDESPGRRAPRLGVGRRRAGGRSRTASARTSPRDRPWLATDGFAADPTLMAEHLSHLGEPFHGGTSTSTGDAIGWLTDLGAQLRNMGAALRSGLVVVGHGTRVSPALQFNGAVLLDPQGMRFVDEEAHGYSSMAGLLQQQPGRACRHGLGRHRDGRDRRLGDDARLPRGRRDHRRTRPWPTSQTGSGSTSTAPRRRSRPVPAVAPCRRRTTSPG